MHSGTRRSGGASGWAVLFFVALFFDLVLAFNLYWVRSTPAPTPVPTTACPQAPETPEPTPCPACPRCPACKKCPETTANAAPNEVQTHIQPKSRLSKKCGDWQNAKTFLAAARSPGAWTDKASNTFNLHSYETIYEKYFSLFNGCSSESGAEVRAPKLFEVGIGPDGSMRSWGTYKNFFGGRDKLEYYALEYINETKFILEQHRKEDVDQILGKLTSEIEQERAAGGSAEPARFDGKFTMPYRNRPSPLREGGRMVVGDQSNYMDLMAALKLWGPFDMIVDDGSHMNTHQIFTFKSIFLHGLAPGGVYFIEDLQTSFNSRFKGGISHQANGQTAIQMINDMIKMLAFHWWMHPDYNRTTGGTVPPKKGVTPLPGEGEEGFVHRGLLSEGQKKNPYGQDIDPNGPNRLFHFLPDIMDWVQTIDCDREICAIRKRLTKLVHRDYQRM